MGTDIHMSAEVKNEKGEWEFVPGPIIDCWSCDGTGFATRWEARTRVPWINDDGTRKPCGWCTNDGTTPEYEGDTGEYYRQRYVQPGKTRDRWYSDRNYMVFALLGNVRNGSGFAGVKTHDPIEPISDNRGIPDDATPETLAVLSDEHSGTWCTLAEVMEYNYNQPIHQHGVISLAQYADCKRTGKNPDSWSGGISGRGIQVITPMAADAILIERGTPSKALPAGLQSGSAITREDAGMDMLMSPVEARQAGVTEYYVQASWMDNLLEYTTAFRERIKLLAAEVGERECRLVYDFDS